MRNFINKLGHTHAAGFMYAVLTIFLIVYTAGSYFTMRNVPRRSSTWALFEFQAKWQDYQMSLDTPQAVLVGPSYARDIGTVPGIRNLGLRAAYPQEVKQIVEQIRPDDTVLFLFSPREIIHSQRMKTRRPGPLSVVHIRVLTAKELVQRKIFPPSRRKAKQANRDLVKMMVRLYEKISTKGVDISFFFDLYKVHPNIMFVFTPMKPEVLTISERKVRVMRSVMLKLRAEMLASGLPFLDLSEAIEGPEMFRDHVHLRPAGRALVRRSLLKAKEIDLNTLPDHFTTPQLEDENDH